MADNIVLDPGAAGATIKTDDDGTAHWQYVKLSFGADNTQTRVTSSVGLPVSDAGGSLTVDNEGLTELAAAINASKMDIDIASSTVDIALGTDISGVFGSASLILATQADNVANTADGLQTTSFGYVYDGTAWDRLRGDATNGVLVNLGTNNDVVVTNTGTFVVQIDGTALTRLTDTETNTDYGTVIGGGTEAAALRVTIANNSTGLISVDDGGGALTVDNGGTFAVQSTLQAGTAEFGKLAAGTAEIGNVKNAGTFAVQSTLQAGTAEFGKLAAGSAAIGTVGVTSTVHPAPGTSGGFNAPFYDNDLDETAISVKAAAGQVYRLFLFNTTAATLYCQIWNTLVGSVTVGSTAPIASIPIPPNDSGVTLDFDSGWEFSTAIVVACTTGPETNGAPAANACLAHIWFE